MTRPTPDDPQLDALIQELLAFPDENARNAFLDRVCKGQPQRRALILKQLQEQMPLEHVDSDEQISGATMETRTSERAGSQIGAYRLREPIGEGGMGTVFVADQQTPIRRRVALKIIKPGMDSRQVIARFESERQALSMMDHPNIAKVLDAGTTDTGRPYFVMELVRGEPITKYCDDHQLTTRERIELFLPVCHAIQHAHQKGIIHRDIKPSNVLVAEYDGQATPKVIDFGVAKAVFQPLTEKTIYTAMGQIVGTLEYMSPEQAKLSQLDVDTRSDVYSLGVLLYELLTGSTPFERQRLRDAAIDEVLRIIREEEPPKPSTKLSHCQTLPTIAANRRTEPAHLSLLVRGDLDWITLKALEKDRNRRYETANGLAMDVQRYLSDQPVLATPPSATYRFRKFARRNRAAMITTAAVVLALVAGLVGTSWQAVRASRAERLAIAERNKKERALQGAVESATAAEQAAAAERLAREAEKELRQKAELAEQEARTERDRAELQRRAAERQFYFASIAREQRRIEDGNHALATMMLRQTPPDLRGWEHQYLTRQAIGTPLTIHRAHESLISNVAFRPHHSQIASGAWTDGRLRIWDIERGQLIASYGPYDAGYGEFVYSPDGSTIFFAEGRSVLMLDADTGTVQRRIETAPQQITQLVLTEDGQTLAVGTLDGTCTLWDVKSERRGLSFHLDGSAISAIAFQADGPWLAVGTRKGQIGLFDSVAGTDGPICTGHQGEVSGLEFAPDQSGLYSCSWDHSIRCWDIASGKQRFAWNDTSHPILTMEMSPDGRQLVYGTAHGDFIVRDLRAGLISHRLSGHVNEARCVAFRPDGTQIVTGSADGCIKIWTPQLDRNVIQLGPASPSALSFSTDGRSLRCVSRSDRLHELQLSTGILATTDLHLPPSSRALLLDPFNERILCITSENAVWQFSLNQPEAGREIYRAPDTMTSLAVSPDASTLLIGRSDNRIEVVKTSSDSSRQLLESLTSPVTWMQFDRDGSRFAIATRDNQISIFDGTSFELLHRLSGHAAPILTMCFSADGTRLVSGSEDRTLRIWNLDDGSCQSIGIGHASPVQAVAMSPDGTRVASGELAQIIKLWDVESGNELLSLRGHDGAIRSLDFDPKGLLLASAAGDDTIRLWDARISSQEIAIADSAARFEKAQFAADAAYVVTTDREGRASTWSSVDGHRLSDVPASTALLPPGSPSADGSKRVYLRSGFPYNYDSQAYLQMSVPSFNAWHEATNVRKAAAPEWHLQSAGVAEQNRDWHAATFHLKQLINLYNASAALNPESATAHTDALNNYRARLARILKDEQRDQQIRPLIRDAYLHWSLHAINRAVRISGGDLALAGWQMKDGILHGSISTIDDRFSADAPPKARFTVSPQSFWNIAYLPPSSSDLPGRLFFGTDTGQMYVCPVDDRWQTEFLFQTPSAVLHSVGDPQGEWLAVGMRDHGVKVYRPDGTLLQDLLCEQLSTAYTLAVRGDGQQLAAVGGQGYAMIWNTADWSVVKELSTPSRKSDAIAYSDDGRLLAIGSENGNVTIFDSSSHDIIREFEAHTELVSTLAFDPSGNWLITGSTDRTLRVWRLADGALAMVGRGHTAQVSTVQMSLDENRVIGAGPDGTILQWIMPTDVPRQTTSPSINLRQNLAYNGGGTDLPRVTASFTSGFDAPERTQDGRVSYRQIGFNRWTNWTSPNPEDWLEIELAQPAEIARVSLAIYEDYGVKAPSQIRIEYWANDDWQPIASPNFLPEGPQAGMFNEITFDQVTTNKVRVVFKPQDLKVKDGAREVNVGVGVTEIAIWPH
jgi:WD40 repeat protein/serine/threonine protein kinase